jgi:hypothetical protein
MTPMNADCQFTQAVTAPQQEDQNVVWIVTSPSVPQPIEQAPLTPSQSQPHQFNTQSCASLPNYISQDEDKNPTRARCTIRSASKSIMQEAILSCVDTYKPQYVVSMDLGIQNYTQTPKLTGTTYTVTPKQMVQCKLPMKWLCEMRKSVLGVNREILEYRHPIANQTTRATWQHSYGNVIGQLAQDMPGCNTVRILVT